MLLSPHTISYRGILWSHGKKIALIVVAVMVIFVGCEDLIGLDDDDDGGNGNGGNGDDNPTGTLTVNGETYSFSQMFTVEVDTSTIDNTLLYAYAIWIKEDDVIVDVSPAGAPVADASGARVLGGSGAVLQYVYNKR